MTIGYEPQIERLVLVKGQDFLHDINPPAGETFPVGTSADLILSAAGGSGDVIATWPATVTPSAISWSVSSTVADTITAPATFRILVHYSDGSDFCWFQGAVARP
jgi:hypothetical protein